MKSKKILASIITFALLASTIFTFNVNAEDIDFDNILPMPMPTVPAASHDEPEYAYIEGTVKDINDCVGADGEIIEGKQIISVVKDESEWTVIIDIGTYFITVGSTDRKAMSIGDSIRVFYNIKAPMLMIYPPQIKAEFAALNLDEKYFIMIDRFDENFLNSKNTFIINVEDTPEIIFEDGIKFEGKSEDLTNRKLVVIYSAATRSMPAKTTPEKIIVMYEKAVAPIYELNEEEKENIALDFESADIIFNGTAIESTKAFLTGDGVLMLPIRFIAERLGFEVTWISETQTVKMGRSLEFRIGEDEYNFSGHDPMSFGIAPVIKDERTYVPVDLFESMPFGKVIVNYYYTEGEIHVDIHIPAIYG